MRVFGYGRVSTVSQTNENQLLELKLAGFDILPTRWFQDQVSGSVQAFQRKEFCRLKERLESGDCLVVTKLDRLGRNMIDVLSTISYFRESGVRLKVLSLGDVDLSSSAGKMLVSVLAAAAELERDLLVERTQAGLLRAKSEGKTLGRRPKVTMDKKQQIATLLSQGSTVSSLAREYGVSRASILAYQREVCLLKPPIGCESHYQETSV